MPTTPAARPSSPSMKLTAFITSTTTKTVIARETPKLPTVKPPIGSETICTPLEAKIQAAAIWPPILAVQSSSIRSSSSPTTTISPPAPTIAQIGPGSLNTDSNQPNDPAAMMPTTIAKKIATPPILGVGVLWTSRALMAGVMS